MTALPDKIRRDFPAWRKHVGMTWLDGYLPASGDEEVRAFCERAGRNFADARIAAKDRDRLKCIEPDWKANRQQLAERLGYSEPSTIAKWFSKEKRRSIPLAKRGLIDKLYEPRYDVTALYDNALLDTLDFIRRALLPPAPDQPMHELTVEGVQLLIDAANTNSDWLNAIATQTDHDESYHLTIPIVAKIGAHPLLEHPFNLLAIAYEWMRPLLVFGYLQGQ